MKSEIFRTGKESSMICLLRNEVSQVLNIVVAVARPPVHVLYNSVNKIQLFLNEKKLSFVFVITIIHNFTKKYMFIRKNTQLTST
jgi:hypothetical protein